jgi:hypothetical protein
MDATTMPKKNINIIQHAIFELSATYPGLKFVQAKSFYWSPETSEIFYCAENDGLKSLWSLLHETGHALLKHKNYKADYELLSLELAAWEKAKELATDMKIKISQDHIEDCMDTYRDWLYKRSICPACETKCLQQDDRQYYRCFNCHTNWRVSTSRFCRAYRSTKNLSHLASA